MKERRGECPECGQVKAVTARGVMRMHLPPKGGDSRRFRDVCSGTGETPKTYADEPPAQGGRIFIGRWAYPFTSGELTALNRFAAAWCKRNGYHEPYIATDGPHYLGGFMTIVAEPKGTDGGKPA